MLNSNQLTVFRAVAEAGGFTRAMEVLQVSQSAISQQVAELETFLGTPLFDRLPRGVRLTPAGETLLGYARRTGTLADEGERAVREGRSSGGGRLAFGTSATLGNYLLPVVLGRFRPDHPLVEIEVATGRAHEMNARLLEGRVDVYLTEEATQDDEHVSVRAFGEDRLVAIAPTGHALAAVAPGQKRPKSIAARVLCEQPLILPEPGSLDREWLDRSLAASGERARNVALTLGSMEAIKAAVAADLGLAVVSRLAVANDLAVGTLVEVPVRDLKAHRPLYEVTLRNRHPSVMVQALGKLLDRAVQVTR